jgi:hypothetical protein
MESEVNEPVPPARLQFRLLNLELSSSIYKKFDDFFIICTKTPDQVYSDWCNEWKYKMRRELEQEKDTLGKKNDNWGIQPNRIAMLTLARINEFKIYGELQEYTTYVISECRNRKIREKQMCFIPKLKELCQREVVTAFISRQHEYSYVRNVFENTFRIDCDLLNALIPKTVAMRLISRLPLGSKSDLESISDDSFIRATIYLHALKLIRNSNVYTKFYHLCTLICIDSYKECGVVPSYIRTDVRFVLAIMSIVKAFFIKDRQELYNHLAEICAHNFKLVEIYNFNTTEDGYSIVPQDIFDDIVLDIVKILNASIQKKKQDLDETDELSFLSDYYTDDECGEENVDYIEDEDDSVYINTDASGDEHSD